MSEVINCIKGSICTTDRVVATKKAFLHSILSNTFLQHFVSLDW